MYLANTLFGVPMAEIGRVFCRDRSTVVYACHVVEDERDDPEFDRKLDVMERLIREEEEALHGV
jgi:chromosomal replication initiation ATPase DnaA